MRRTAAAIAYTVVPVMLLGCSDTVSPGQAGDYPAGPPEVWVQAIFDQADVSFRFTWVSHPKSLPSGSAISGQVYPGQFHDLLQHDGTRFERLPAASRLQEDRVSFMVGSGSTFQTTGCWIACHTGMEEHNLTAPGVLDHWHWRGGRSGPMGYAEDAGVNHISRIRDGLGIPQSGWIRVAGDRLREDQAALVGTGHALVEGFPRFIFNKGKQMPGGYTIPRFFIANEAGAVITNAHTEIPNMKDLSVNRSLLVAYQDLSFDPIDKVNAIDLGYLVHVATGGVAHLPAHLRSPGTPAYGNWTAYWGSELGVSLSQEAAAETLLSAVHAEWQASGGMAMVARSIGFIYPSSQHDITSTREFDASEGQWIVTLTRKLNTGHAEDADLTGLRSGVSFPIAFAMHNAGGGSESHDVTFPVMVGSGSGADIPARQVPDVHSVVWSTVPAFETRFIKPEYLWRLEDLKSVAHPGAAFVSTVRCQNCHGVSTKRLD